MKQLGLVDALALHLCSVLLAVEDMEKSQSNWLVLWPCRFEAVICMLLRCNRAFECHMLPRMFELHHLPISGTCCGRNVFYGRLLAVGHSSASSSLGSILLPGHACLQGAATEAGALPGCFLAGALARWYQFGRQEGTPIAE